MPRGYPDYFGQSIFPKYGSTQVSTLGITVVPTNEVKYIADLSLKGVTTRGFMKITNVTDPTKVYVIFKADGQSIPFFKLSDLYDFLLYDNMSFPFFLVCYDTANNKYVVGLGMSLSFEYEFKFGVYNLLGTDIYVTGCVFYYQIV